MRMRKAKRRDIILRTKRTRMLRALLCALALALCMLPALHPAAPTAAEGGDSRVRVLLSRLQIEDEMHIRFDGVYAAGENDLLTFPRSADCSFR